LSFFLNVIRVASRVMSCTVESLKGKQEAQLSQRDCAPLHVIEYLAKSLKVTQGHSK